MINHDGAGEGVVMGTVYKRHRVLQSQQTTYRTWAFICGRVCLSDFQLLVVPASSAVSCLDSVKSVSVPSSVGGSFNQSWCCKPKGNVRGEIQRPFDLGL